MVSVPLPLSLFLRLPLPPRPCITLGRAPVEPRADSCSFLPSFDRAAPSAAAGAFSHSSLSRLSRSRRRADPVSLAPTCSFFPARVLRTFLKRVSGADGKRRNIPIQAIGLSLYEEVGEFDGGNGLAMEEKLGKEVIRTQWLDFSTLGNRPLIGRRILIVVRRLPCPPLPPLFVSSPTRALTSSRSRRTRSTTRARPSATPSPSSRRTSRPSSTSCPRTRRPTSRRPSWPSLSVRLQTLAQRRRGVREADETRACRRQSTTSSRRSARPSPTMSPTLPATTSRTSGSTVRRPSSFLLSDRRSIED